MFISRKNFSVFQYGVDKIPDWAKRPKINSEKPVINGETAVKNQVLYEFILNSEEGVCSGDYIVRKEDGSLLNITKDNFESLFYVERAEVKPVNAERFLISPIGMEFVGDHLPKISHGSRKDNGFDVIFRSKEKKPAMVRKPTVTLIEMEYIGEQDIRTLHGSYKDSCYAKPPENVTKAIRNVMSDKSVSLVAAAESLGISITEMSLLRVGKRYSLSDKDLEIAVKLIGEANDLQSKK